MKALHSILFVVAAFDFAEAELCFSVMKNLGSYCEGADAVAFEVDILCYILAFFANCNFQKRGHKYFAQHSVYSC